MGFWSWLTAGGTGGEKPNANPPSSVGPPSYNPGNPHGLYFAPPPDGIATRALPSLQPSPWSGWPAEWSTAFDMYGTQLGKLVDTAWDAIDLNTRVLASMPGYRVKNGKALPPATWMTMPAPGLYASWSEFVKELFWHFHLGETFILSLARNSQGYPAALAVVPPWIVDFERGAYRINGYPDLDQRDLLHIRYARRGSGWRGVGSLEQAGARVTAASLLARYQAEYLQSGGIPHYWFETDRPLTPPQIEVAKNEWAASRAGASAAEPAFAGGGLSLKTANMPSPRDVMLLEIEQWNEARIAIKLGVPPYLLGLPSGGDPMTYKNAEGIYDFHFRSSLRPMMNTVMTALSNWALPSGQSVELNGDEYTRPPLGERVTAYQILNSMGALSVDEIRAMERFGADDAADVTAVTALTGGDQ